MKAIFKSAVCVAMAMSSMALYAQEVLIMSCELDEKQRMLAKTGI